MLPEVRQVPQLNFCSRITGNLDEAADEAKASLMKCGRLLWSEVMKKNNISAGEGNSIIIHAHFVLIFNPHPSRLNLP